MTTVSHCADPDRAGDRAPAWALSPAGINRRNAARVTTGSVVLNGGNDATR